MLKHLLAVALAPLPMPSWAQASERGLHIRWRWGWLRGWAARPFWRARELLGGPRIRVGRRFALLGSLEAHGPGEVVFGDDVTVDAVTTPFTHAREARIEIGSRSYVNGTRFGCASLIRIGDGAILGDARLIDTDFHSLHPAERHDPRVRPATAPILLDENVWVGAGAAVLKGVHIGKDAVVGFGSVVVHDVEPGAVVAGNPARAVARVPGG
jgi:acetyltransferase-like isoleucine patch superfamily enzyme